AFRDGLRDTLALALEELQSIETPQEAEPLQVFRALDRLLQEAGTQLEALPADLPGWYAWLGLMEQRSAESLQAARQLAEQIQEEPAELLRWLGHLGTQAHDLRSELAGLAPWLDVTVNASRAAGMEMPLDKRLRLPASLADLVEEIDELSHSLASEEAAVDTGRLPLLKAVASSTAPALLDRCQRIADRAGSLASEMEFRILYNDQRNLFSIGFNVTLNRLDNAHYDL